MIYDAAETARGTRGVVLIGGFTIDSAVIHCAARQYLATRALMPALSAMQMKRQPSAAKRRLRAGEMGMRKNN